MSKKYTTNFLEDTNGSTGSANQVLVSTAAGIDWVDGSGSGIIGGPYLPLAGGGMTGNIIFNNSVAETWKDNAGGTTRMMILNSGNVAYIGPVDSYAGGPIFYGVSANVSAQTFYTGASARMHIDSSGNVGIGTTSPGSTLTVSGQSSNQFQIINSANNKSWRPNVNGNDFYITESGVSNPFVIQAGGNVGIGTTTPRGKLTVGGGGHIIGDTSFRIGSTGTGNTPETAIKFTDTALTYYVANGIKMLINSSGNVGIGTTSPGVKLDVRSSTTGNLAGRVWNPNTGTNSSATFRIASSANNANSARLEFSDAGYYTATVSGDRVQGLVFRTSATGSDPITIPERMRIDTSGNVGIGTSSPVAKLHVSGDSSSAALPIAKVESTGTISYLKFFNSSTGTGSSDGAYIGMNGGTAYFMNKEAGNLYLGTGDNFNLTLENGGNVGIGTTSPDTLIHASASSGATLKLESTTTTLQTGGVLGAIEFETQDAGSEGVNAKINTIFENTVGATSMQFFTSPAFSTITSTPQMVIDSAGNVGIGTTSPGVKLDVNGDVFINSNYTGANAAANDLTIGKTTTGNHGITIATGPTYTGSIYFGDSGNNDAGIIGYQHSDNSMKFTTNRSEKMRITASGNVGINETSPQNTLHVNGTLRVGPYFATSDRDHFLVTPGGSVTTVSTPNENANYDNSVGNIHIRTNSGYATPVERLTVLAGGNVGIGTTSPDEMLHIENSLGANIILNSNTGAVNNGIYMSEGASSTPAQNGAYFYYDSSANAVKLDTGTSSLSTKLTVLRDSGNVGIGTDSPASKLHIDSTGEALRFTRTGQEEYRIVHGSSGLYFTRPNSSALALGITQNSDVEIFNTSGSVMFKADGSTSNVGIGTTSPGSPLSVVGSYSSSDEIIEIGGGTGINTDFKLKIGAVDQDYIWFQSVKPGDNYYDLVFNPTAGNVGIGTTSPGTKLHVNGGIITVNDGTGITYYEGVKINSYDSNGYDIIGREGLTLSTVSADKDIILSPTGNVGIGTTSPDSKLDVTGGDITVNTGGTGFMTFKYGAVGSETSRGSITTDGVDLKVNATADLLLLPSGNVGIGTTSPGEKLEVSGNVKAETLIATDLTDGYVPYSKSSTLGLQDSKIYTQGAGIGVGTTTLAAGCHITSLSNISATGYRVSAMQTAPAARNSTGTLGEIRITSNYIYVCYATNSWSRVALATSW